MRTAKVADCKCAKKCGSSPALDEYTEMTFICVLKLYTLEHKGSQKPERKLFCLLSSGRILGFFLQILYLIRLQTSLTLRPS